VTTEAKKAMTGCGKERLHAQCLLCGSEHPQGFGLFFSTYADGHVEAVFFCESRYQGYTGYLHGGIISSLLDSAMTNCLFAQGHAAMTGELKVRFLKPVVVNRNALVSARLVKSYSMLFNMEAELRQNKELMARAKGKFMKLNETDNWNDFKKTDGSESIIAQKYNYHE